MQCLFGMYLSEKRAGSYFYLKQIGSVWSALGGGSGREQRPQFCGTSVYLIYA